MDRRARIRGFDPGSWAKVGSASSLRVWVVPEAKLHLGRATSGPQAAPKRLCGAPGCLAVFFCVTGEVEAGYSPLGTWEGVRPHQTRSSSLREQVMKFDPRRGAWLVAELGLGFRTPSLESVFMYLALQESDSFRTLLGNGSRVKKFWLYARPCHPPAEKGTRPTPYLSDMLQWLCGLECHFFLTCPPFSPGPCSAEPWLLVLLAFQPQPRPLAP